MSVFFVKIYPFLLNVLIYILYFERNIHIFTAKYFKNVFTIIILLFCYNIAISELELNYSNNYVCGMRPSYAVVYAVHWYCYS